MNRATFLAHAFALATKYSASCTSWVRSPDRNYRVGGLPNSCHLNGFAVDLVSDYPENHILMIEEARTLGLDAIQHMGHVHIEVDPANQTDD